MDFFKRNRQTDDAKGTFSSFKPKSERPISIGSLVPLPSFNMMQLSMNMLTDEIIGEITFYLAWFQIMALLLSGDKTLRFRLLQLHNIRHMDIICSSRAVVDVHSMVIPFKGLRSFKLDLNFNYPKTFVPTFDLTALQYLPVGLECMSLFFRLELTRTLLTLPRLFKDSEHGFPSLRSFTFFYDRQLDHSTYSSLFGFLDGTPERLAELTMEIRNAGLSQDELTNLCKTFPFTLEKLSVNCGSELRLEGWLNEMKELRTLELNCPIVSNDLMEVLSCFQSPHLEHLSLGSTPPSLRSFLDHLQAPLKKLPRFPFNSKCFCFNTLIQLTLAVKFSHEFPPNLTSLYLRLDTTEGEPLAGLKSLHSLTKLEISGPLPPSLDFLPPKLKYFAGSIPSWLSTYQKNSSQNMKSVQSQENWPLVFPPSLERLVSWEAALPKMNKELWGFLPILPSNQFCWQNCHFQAMPGPPGHVSAFTLTRWESLDEVIQKDLVSVLAFWWSPSTLSFGPMHHHFQQLRCIRSIVQYKSVGILQWLVENSPSLVSSFALLERLDMPHDAQLLTSVSLLHQRFDIYRWLQITGFRKPRESIHILLDSTWDQEIFDLVVSKGDLLDLPNEASITALTRVLVEPTEPDLQKWHRLVSFGATSFSLEWVLRYMLETGNLSILTVVLDSFPDVKLSWSTLVQACQRVQPKFLPATIHAELVLDHLITSNCPGFDIDIGELRHAIGHFLTKTNLSEQWFINLFHWSIEKGVEVLKIPYIGRSGTILHWAVHRGFLTVIEFLDSIGADWNEENVKGQNPYAVAKLAGKTKIANFLEQKTAFTSTDHF